jgi:predicted ATP-dependent protease
VQNVDNLVLGREVMDGIQKGEFHVYAVHTLDEGLEVLTGIRAGDVRAENTIHHRASGRLERFSNAMQRLSNKKDGATAFVEEGTGERS